MLQSVKKVFSGLLLLLLVQMMPVMMPLAIADVSPIELLTSKVKPKIKPRKQPPLFKGTLLPFFDQIDNPVAVGFPKNQKVDITPLPPQLNAFDRKVLQTCGAFGSLVSTINLRRRLAESPDVVQAIKQAIGGEIFAGRRTDQQFSDDLLTIWSNRRGFEHIFCGQLNGPEKIGGLHFAGRYLQLQTDGIAGRLPNNSNTEEVAAGEIYTLGVVIVQDGRVLTKDPKKGYAYNTDAQAILINATQAFKQFKATRKQTCLYTTPTRAGQRPFQEVLVITERAIVTFYPDATPSKTDPSCNRR